MDNVVVTLLVQEVRGMDLVAIVSDIAPSMQPTVSLRMVVKRVLDNALRSLRMELVAARTMKVAYICTGSLLGV